MRASTRPAPATFTEPAPPRKTAENPSKLAWHWLCCAPLWKGMAMPGGVACRELHQWLDAGPKLHTSWDAGGLAPT